MASSKAIGKGRQLHSFDKSERERYQDNVQQDGVYILWNPGSPKGKPTIYVGSSREHNRGVAGRLYQHHKGQTPKRFWKQTFVVTGNSGNLSKSCVRYVEYWLYQRAREVAKTRDFRLNNKKTPPIPGKSKRQENEEFLQNLLHQLPKEVAAVFNQAQISESTERPRPARIPNSFKIGPRPGRRLSGGRQKTLDIPKRRSDIPPRAVLRLIKDRRITCIVTRPNRKTNTTEQHLQVRYGNRTDWGLSDLTRDILKYRGRCNGWLYWEYNGIPLSQLDIG